MSNNMEQEYRALFSIDRLSSRWDVSEFTIRRRIAVGDLKSITIGGRRLVPASEVERAETQGIGRPRRSAMSAEVAATK